MSTPRKKKDDPSPPDPSLPEPLPGAQGTLPPRGPASPSVVPTTVVAPVTINVYFSLLFAANALLCFGSFLVMVCFAANFPQMSEGQKRLYDTCDMLLKTTAGVFIGMLGGRAAAPDSIKRRKVRG